MSRRTEATSSGSSRRAFLKGGAAAAALSISGLAAAEPRALPRRPFGATGAHVTVFGLGCFPLGSLSSDEEGAGLVLRALEGGCNYLDTAPSYSKGSSERRVGMALRAYKGTRPIVATKTHTRTADAAWRDLEGSLQRMGLERVDLLQIHAIKDAADLDLALDEKNGPLAALLKAREQKLVRWLGVTGHFDPATMRRTFERFPFDSILFPLNCVDAQYQLPGDPPERLSFVEQTLPAAVENGLARVAMKVFASGALPRNGLDPARCLRFTYGLDISTCVVGCATAAEVDLALGVAREATALSETERRELLEAARASSGPRVEWYKRR